MNQKGWELEKLLTRVVLLEGVDVDDPFELHDFFKRHAFEEEERDITFRNPGYISLMGSTMSGKTRFLVEVIKQKDKMIRCEKGKIVETHYFYKSDWQKIFDDLEKRGVIFHHEYPYYEKLKTITEDAQPRIVVIDDFMADIYQDPKMIDFLSQMVHHHNLLVFVTQQALFPISPSAVSLRSQCTGMVLFNFSTENVQVRQMLAKFTGFAHNSAGLRALMHYYKDKTAKRGGYLFINLHQDSPANMKFSSHIRPDEGPTEVFRLDGFRETGGS